MHLEPSNDELIRAEELRITGEMCHAFVEALLFSCASSSRDTTNWHESLLYYLSDDLFQGVLAINMLMKEGMDTAAIRECRFLIEAVVKVCVIEQQAYGVSIAEKLRTYDSVTETTNISSYKSIKFTFLSDAASFLEELGRIYGECSKIVHLGNAQIQERIGRVASGNSIGNETSAQVRGTNRIIARALACILVCVFHAIPPFVVGDFLVMANGESKDWYFAKSKFIAMIDEHHDYKHERKEVLGKVQHNRAQRVKF